MSLAEEVAAYVGRDPADANLAGFIAVAQGLIAGYLAEGAYRCPEAIRDQAVKEVVAALYNRREAPGGALQFAGADSPVIRLSADQLRPVRQMLAPYRDYVVG